MRQLLTLLIISFAVFPAKLGAEQASGITMILLERDACFGTCPEYLVRVTKNGAVQFEGKSWVRDFGPREGTVSQQDFARLVKAFEDAAFDELPDEFPDDACGTFSTCNTTVWISAMRDARLKRVAYYLGCTGGRFEDDFSRIIELGERIDEIVGTSRWIGPRDERRATADDPDSPLEQTPKDGAAERPR